MLFFLSFSFLILSVSIVLDFIQRDRSTFVLTSFISLYLIYAFVLQTQCGSIQLRNALPIVDTSIVSLSQSIAKLKKKWMILFRWKFRRKQTKGWDTERQAGHTTTTKKAASIPCTKHYTHTEISKKRNEWRWIIQWMDGRKRIIFVDVWVIH